MKTSDKDKKQTDFSLAKHQLFHHSMKILIEPIMSGDFDLHTDNGILWCYPFLSILLGDLPKHHAITLTYNSANCKMPCHICITPKDELNNPLIDHSTIEIRIPETMHNVLVNGMSKDYSLHNIENPF